MIRRKIKAIVAVSVLSLGLMAPGTAMWVTGAEADTEAERFLEVEAPELQPETAGAEEEASSEEVTEAGSEANAMEETAQETEAEEDTSAETETEAETENGSESEVMESEIPGSEEITETQALLDAGGDQPAEDVETTIEGSGKIEADTEKSAALSKTAAYSDKDAAALAVREGMKNRQNTVILSFVSEGELTQSGAESIGKEIYNKAIAHTGVPDEGDYLKWHRAVAQQISVQDLATDGTSTSFTLVFAFEYTSTPDEEAAVGQAAAEVMETIALDQYETDYEKVFAIYDHICSNVAYWEYTAAESAYYILSHSAYAAFVEHEAVCQGYALMFYRLALTAGIDNRLISGYAEDTGVAHGWNIVKIGDRYYEVDATWDAGKEAYDYFLLGSERFENTNHVTHSNYTTNKFQEEYPLGLTYVFPNGEAHTHITSGWTSDGNALEDTHHTWCYLCGETEASEPHTWDEGQIVVFYLYEGETFEEASEEFLAADEDDEDEDISEVTALVYTCEKCGEMHMEEVSVEEIIPDEDETSDEEIISDEEDTFDEEFISDEDEIETEDIVEIEIVDEPTGNMPNSPAAEQEDDEPVLLEEKSPRVLPKTKAPENKPVETSDPTPFGADIFLLISTFGVMAVCLPLLRRVRKQ